MNFIGLDLSLTHSGFCVLNFEKDQVIKNDVIKTDKMRGMSRCSYILDNVMHWVLKSHPSMIAIEGYSFGSQGRAIYGIGELGGIIRYHLFQNHCKWIEVAPGSLKKFLTGKGNAQKNQMLMYGLKVYHKQFIDDNQCDAFVLSMIAKHYYMKKSMNVENVFNHLRKHQKEVILKLLEKENKNASIE